MTLSIRERTRIQSSPPNGLETSWTEYQVVEGRRVLSRHSHRAEAEEAIQERRALASQPAREEGETTS